MTVFDLDDFLAQCQGAIDGGSGPPAIRAVLERASAVHGSIPEAVGEPVTGSLQTIHRASDLTVLNVVWTPGMRIAPHDHTMTAAILVYGGREDNEFFRLRDDGGVDKVGGATLAPGDVTMLGRDGIHSVQAHATRYTGAIHVYAGDFFDRERRTWDAASGDREDDPRPVPELFAEAEAAYAARTT